MKIKLRTIIANFLSSKDSSSHEFVRLYNIGVRGCREFNMDIQGRFKTVILDVNANKTVTLPDDYLNFSKAGVFNGAGEVATFKRNPDLSGYNAMYTAQARYSGAPTVNTGDNTTYPYAYFNYWNNGVGYTLFGLPSGTATIGEFNIDEEAGVILLDPNNAYSQIVFEYLSTGYDEEAEDYEIDAKAEEAFICYLRWQNAIDLNKKFSQNHVDGLRREYYRQKGLAKRRLNPVIISEMQAAYRRSVKLVAKA